MSVKKRDPLTGHQTTGHEWNGITELNTRVPRVIWWFIGITHLYALVAWVLLPSWPLIETHTKGLLGLDQQEQVRAAIVAGELERIDWHQGVDELPLDAIRTDASLMEVVQITGPALFGDNCAACHGQLAMGGPGFPNLVDESWLWGGDLETIHETIRAGINADHPESRFSEMPGFRDFLEPPQRRALVEYVQSLSGAPVAPEQMAEGQELFLANCAGCHGEDARGNNALGAPNLTDESWIYGASDAAIYETVSDGRRGWMPAWEGRITEVDRKILTLYLVELAEEVEP